VPAPDARIQTWDDFRWNFSKNVFSILRSATGSGIFILRAEVSYLQEEALASAIAWYEDFFEWQRAEFQREMSEAATALAASPMDGARALAAKLQEALNGGSWNALTTEADRAHSLVSGISGSTNEKINGALKEQLKKNPKFIDELAQFLDTLGQEPEPQLDDAEDSEAPDDDEDNEVAHTPKTKAINRYKQALRSDARAREAKRSLDKASPTAKIIAWIGDRTLSDADLAEIGKALLTQQNAKRFTKPIHRYINDFHRRYRKFRKLRQSEGRWYSSAAIEARDIHALELDVILLAMLRAAMPFLSRAQVVAQLDRPLWGALKPIYELYRNQVLVDEATDFSPVQLACMAALTHPKTKSFFACGDFNQRLTTWGARSADEVKWITAGLEFQEVNIAYRQTRQLNTLARDIIAAVGGSNPIVELPKDVDNEGVAPALIEGTQDFSLLARWLADRLQEIERFVGQMPSTAIFVNAEDDVVPLAEQLDKVLMENNLRVVACSKGQIVGQDNDIRVFDIQHIKGLEVRSRVLCGGRRAGGEASHAVRQISLRWRYARCNLPWDHLRWRPSSRHREFAASIRAGLVSWRAVWKPVMNRAEKKILQHLIRRVAHHNENLWWELKRQIWEGGYQTHYPCQDEFDHATERALMALSEPEKQSLIREWRAANPGHADWPDDKIVLSYLPLVIAEIVRRANLAAYRTVNW